jgi:hypothetical protein
MKQYLTLKLLLEKGFWNKKFHPNIFTWVCKNNFYLIYLIYFDISEEIIAYLATEAKEKGLDPVFSEQEFKTKVADWLDKGFGLTFRDQAEIMQACSFLHENGVLLHYEDSTLRDLYFLDPQWLCDMLAHVVTVREINPFAKNGVMKVDDLLHLFKSQSIETRDYVMSLLSKFELAVPFDNTRLLIPSLLPSLEQVLTNLLKIIIIYYTLHF